MIKRILLALFVSLFIYGIANAVNTITCQGDPNVYQTCTITLDATGDVCYAVKDTTQHSALFDFTSGTIAVNWQASINGAPTGGESIDLLGSDVAADAWETQNIITPGWLCFSVVTCTTCVMTIYATSAGANNE